MNYRPDIEGLRALAIVPVVLFHAWPGLLPGGFVGVDVFFVVSGFLITSLLLDRLQTSTYGLASFYAARVRRIFPALFTMLLIVTAAAWLLLTPAAFVEHLRVVAATSVFVSNLELRASTDYFGTAAELKPLVHTWSLAVEEQYYLIFPPLLALIWKFARSWLPWVLVGAGLISLGYSQRLLVHGDGAGAYYSAASRAFELMVGSWLAWWSQQRGTHSSPRTWLALLGLALVSGSFLAIDRYTSFPGWVAVIPCVGTALLIAAGPDTPLNRMLARQPLRWLGGLSFSLYLWHWPVLVFVRHWARAEPTAIQAALGLALSLLLAMASLRLIEAPVRRSVWLNQKRLLIFGAASIVLTIGMAWQLERVVHRADLSSAYDAMLLSGASDVSPERGRCHSREGRPIAFADRCLLGAQGTQERLAVWGDSHGVELAYAIAESLPAGRVAQLTGSTCPPSLGNQAFAARGCEALNEETLKGLLAAPQIKHVILIARHEHYVRDASASESYAQGLKRAVDALMSSGKQVWLIEPVPTYGYPVPAGLALSGRLGKPMPMQSREEYRQKQSKSLAVVQDVAAKTGASVLRVEPVLCPRDLCLLQGEDGLPLYFDDNHLSGSGARYLARQWKDVFGEP